MRKGNKFTGATPESPKAWTPSKSMQRRMVLQANKAVKKAKKK